MCLLGTMKLCVCFLEFLHALDEGVDSLLGTSIVEGCAEAAYGAVALDAYHTAP